MKPSRRPPSLVAEKAVRYLAERSSPVDSVELAREVLSTRVAAEPAARRVLETAFCGDPRLVYESGAWKRSSRIGPRGSEPFATPETSRSEAVPERDRVLLLLRGFRRARGLPFELSTVSAVRLRGDDVIAACGGSRAKGPTGERLRRGILAMLEDAIPVMHDPPGALAALEAWLDRPLDDPISIRRLAGARLGLRQDADLSSLADRLGLVRRETEDPLEDVGVLDECLAAIRGAAESLEDLRGSLLAAAPPIEWSRYGFDRAFLQGLPHEPGTYRFFDSGGALLYVGKAKNLNRRVGSYFREGARPARVEALLRSLHHIEIDCSGSDLEAILREAALIAKRDPSQNVQREVRLRGGRADRLRSILILEPAQAPFVLRAYLLRNGELVGRVPIGPKGGGVRRVERLLEDRFFSFRAGPSGEETTAVDVELIARWLSAHRDSVVALDPTHFRRASDVGDKLRWFIARGGLRDSDGSPIHVR